MFKEPFFILNMLQKSNIFNSSYCGKIIKVTNIRKHPNADRLQLVSIHGNEISVGLDIQLNDLLVYFPALSQLEEEFLRVNNLYKNSIKNINPEVKGFFENNGVIKPINLRSIKSMGFLATPEMIKIRTGYVITEADVNKEFDYISKDCLIVKRYEIPTKNNGKSSISKKADTLKSKIYASLGNQFNFHDSTHSLVSEACVLNPDDTIIVTEKLHGTSAVFGKVLSEEIRTGFSGFLKDLLRIKKSRSYVNVYSSRRVIRGIGNWLNSTKGYYSNDVWRVTNNKLQDLLLNGETVYGEIVGFTEDGEYIQTDYDYKCEPNTSKFYIYKITMTNDQGIVIPLSFDQMEIRAKELGVETVPLKYYGKAKHFDFSLRRVKNENFKEEFLKVVYNDHANGQPCTYNNNKVPAEGVCITILKGFNPNIYKVKSFDFIQREFKDVSNQVTNIEDEN